MDNTQKAVEIVTWLFDHWVAVAIGLVVVAVAAFLAAALTEWRKRHISKKTEEKVEGWLVQKTLALSSALFGGLSVALPFMHTYLPMLSSLKYVGGFVVSVYAAANFLYALKFKKWFKAVQSYLEARRAKLEAKKAVSNANESEQPQPQLQPQTLDSGASPFEGPAL